MFNLFHFYVIMSDKSDNDRIVIMWGEFIYKKKVRLDNLLSFFASQQIEKLRDIEINTMFLHKIFFFGK